MQKQILLGVVACLGISALCGCSAPEPQATTPKDKVGFAGTEMPADVKAKFDAEQRTNASSAADMAAKGRAGAGK